MTVMTLDATTSLLRGIRAAFRPFDGMTVERIASTAWVSATFSGARHELLLRLAGEDAETAADAFLDNLEEKDFRLRGHILADIKLRVQRRRRELCGMVVNLELEALTVEDS